MPKQMHNNSIEHSTAEGRLGERITVNFYSLHLSLLGTMVFQPLRVSMQILKTYEPVQDIMYVQGWAKDWPLYRDL
jgi:hypothetical protein